MQTLIPTFHEWLQSQLSEASHDKLDAAIITIGCGPQYLKQNLIRRQFPRPPRMERIGHYFGAPPSWITQWNAEAVRHWGDNADTQLSLAGLRKAERWPCLDCDQTIYKSAWKRGVRRCPDCQRKHGRGFGQRRTPKNPLAQYVLAMMRRTGMKGRQLSLKVGRNPAWFSVACVRSTWRPSRADLEALARELDDDADHLIRIASGTHEEVRHLQGKRVQILRLATQVDRAQNNGSRDCYDAIYPLIETETSINTLDRIRATLVAEQRAPNPEGLRKGAAKLKGRKRSPEDIAKFSEGRRRTWQLLSQEERRERTSHLHTVAVAIRISVARHGKDRIAANLEEYIQQAATRHQLPGAAIRPMVRDALGVSTMGRPTEYNHPEICKGRRSESTWSELGGEKPRIAHRQWHRIHGVPSCSPDPP